MNRAEAQRRRERQERIFIALSREKRFRLQAQRAFWVLTGEAGDIHGFSAALRLCATNLFYDIAKCL